MNYGLRDKVDDNEGLKYGPSDKKITVRNNLIFCDSRDCVGERSLAATQLVFSNNGGRNDFVGNITLTTGVGVSPITVTISKGITIPSDLKVGDIVNVVNVKGNTNANGSWAIRNITTANPGTFELVGSIGNGNYSGGGYFTRFADQGWPVIKDTTSTIIDNTMTIKLNKKLKVIRSLSLVHAVIPRDIIPIIVYLPDLVEFSLFTNNDIPEVPEVRTISGSNRNIPVDIVIGGFVGLGVTLELNDRVLLINQTNKVENGIYVVTAGAPVRANDMLAGMPALTVVGYYLLITESSDAGDTYVCTIATDVVGVGELTFVEMTNFASVSRSASVPISWASFIPPEREYLTNSLVGFYSTPISVFRSYINGAFSLPNSHTPPPLKLWNPVVTASDHQIAPYPHQVVPVYTSDNITVPGRSETFYVQLSGYGLYDLNDWTYRFDVSNVVNVLYTTIARQLLLLAICRPQSYLDEDYITLIINSSVTSNSDPLLYFGYGDYQRFVPGPGVGMHYQPGTTDFANPTELTVSKQGVGPVVFRDFVGNVWGPYNSPGDKFQRMGMRDTLQDLFLNGDLENLNGTSIIKTWVKIPEIITDKTFGLNFPAFVNVNFGNIDHASNPNIVNAMRIYSNGYGALDVQSLGQGRVYTTIFRSAGGQGPDRNGVPVRGYSSGSAIDGGGAWVPSEVVNSSGVGQFGDERASGINYNPTIPNNMTIEHANANYPGDNPDFVTGVGNITERTSYYDLGANNGRFIADVISYRNWVIAELPDTNLVLHVFEAERDIRVQSTNSNVSNAILSCPIRLNLGTTSGTQEYVESVQSLIASSSEYWEKRYLAPLASLYKLSIKFTTYEGNEIPLETMLQASRSIVLLEIIQRVFGSSGIAQISTILSSSDLQTSFIFDPLNPELIGRMKRNLSLIFKVDTYEYESPGLNLGIITNMLEQDLEQDEDNDSFLVRASNYQNYN